MLRPASEGQKTGDAFFHPPCGPSSGRQLGGEHPDLLSQLNSPHFLFSLNDFKVLLLKLVLGF